MKKTVCLSVIVAAAAALAAAAVLLTRKPDTTAPKPAGYFRIDLPTHEYTRTDTTLPFTFNRSVYSKMTLKPQKDGSAWMDLEYPRFRAAFKFTYFPLNGAAALRDFLVKEDKMVKFHFQKADDVEYSVIKDTENRLWGQIYDIEGKETATPLQFWMTDSAHHFLRATLYFDFTPNNDSLQPVIQYLRDDAMEMVNSFAWR